MPVLFLGLYIIFFLWYTIVAYVHSLKQGEDILGKI